VTHICTGVLNKRVFKSMDIFWGSVAQLGYEAAFSSTQTCDTVARSMQKVKWPNR